MSTAEQRADHERDHLKHQANPRHQKRVVGNLIGYLHGLLHDGLIPLSPEIEKHLRARMRNVCLEFDMDPPGGREAYIPRAEPVR